MGSIFQIIAMIGFVVGVLGVALVFASVSQGRSAGSGVGIAAVGFIAGLVFMVVSQGLLIVEPTQRAVIFNVVSGQLETPRGAGISIILPGVQQATIYPISNQTYYMTDDPSEGARQKQDAIVARSTDGQEVRVNAILTYKLDGTPDGLNTIHQEWSNQSGGYAEGFIRPVMNNTVQRSISHYSAENIYGSQRAELETEITAALKTTFEENGISMVAFRILELNFNPEFTAAIERKEIEQQELQRAETEATRVQTQAKGQADAAIEAAKGEAESQLIRARAEAESLNLISEQLAKNPYLIQYRFVETLSDNINLMMVPSNSPFLFDAQGMLNQLGTPPTAETGK